MADEGTKASISLGADTSDFDAGINSAKKSLNDLGAAAAKATAPLASGAGSMEKLGVSAKQTAAALRGVPAQFTDIVTALQGGQAPLTVFLQQGGQLKDMFGGAGPAARALGGYILGLVNPLTIAGAAAAALGVAFVQGQNEGQAYARALILTGNAAGVTQGQLAKMAQSISAVAGTQGAAAEALTALASTGEVAGGVLEKAGLAAVQFERVGGGAIKETVKNFEDLGKNPLEAAIKLDRQMNFLTQTTYRQIKALDDQGRTAEAARVAQEAYADAIISRSGALEGNLGLLEKAWKAVGDTARGAWDRMLNIGRPQTLEQQLEEAQQQLRDAQKGFAQTFDALGNVTGGGVDEGLAQARVNGILAEIAARDKNAKAAADENKQKRAGIEFDKERDKYLSKTEQMNKELARVSGLAKEAGISGKQLDDVLQGIRDKYTDKPKKGANPLLIDKAELAEDLAAIQNASQQLIRTLSNQERVVEAQRNAGGVSDEEYYRKRREFIIADNEIQEYALRQQVARLQQEKLSGKDAIDNRRQIAAAESKIALLQADTSSKLEVLAIQQEAAAKRLAVSFLTARQAAQDYFDSVQRQQARELTGIGQGEQTRARNAGLSQIEDRYAGQRRDLENQKAQLELEGKFTEESRRQYEVRLALINEFQTKALDSYSAFFDQRLKLEQDATLGAQEALRNYFDNAQQLGKQTEGLVTNTLGGIEDAFVSLATSGKANFKSLASSIVADIIRIQVRAALAKLTASIFGGGSGAGVISGGSGIGATAGDSFWGSGVSFGTRAGGGSVEAGRTYLVGEQGPELLRMGANSGTVIPNNAIGSAMGAPRITIENHGAEIEEQTDDTGALRLVVRTATRSAVNAVKKDMLSGTGQIAVGSRARNGGGAGNLVRRR